MKKQFPPRIRYWPQVYRKRVETMGCLLERRLPQSIHAVTSIGFELKVVLFVLAVSVNLAVR